MPWNASHDVSLWSNSFAVYDCQECPLKAKCCPNTPSRKIERSPFEAARDVARNIAKTDAYQQSRKDRKKVEMLIRPLEAHPQTGSAALCADPTCTR